jgi:hypothetical protein
VHYWHTTDQRLERSTALLRFKYSGRIKPSAQDVLHFYNNVVQQQFVLRNCTCLNVLCVVCLCMFRGYVWCDSVFHMWSIFNHTNVSCCGVVHVSLCCASYVCVCVFHDDVLCVSAFPVWPISSSSASSKPDEVFRPEPLDAAPAADHHQGDDPELTRLRQRELEASAAQRQVMSRFAFN